MPARSAGLLLHRPGEQDTEVLLVLPGGPFWRGRDVGAWQIPKGLIEPGEEPEAAAVREVQEELGTAIVARLYPLGSVRQAGGKIVEAFAVAQEFDPAALVSNRFEIEWPPRSGRRQSFPEVDRAAWLSLEEARRLMLPSQLPLLDALERVLAGN